MDPSGQAEVLQLKIQFQQVKCIHDFANTSWAMRMAFNWSYYVVVARIWHFDLFTNHILNIGICLNYRFKRKWNEYYDDHSVVQYLTEQFWPGHWYTFTAAIYFLLFRQHQFKSVNWISSSHKHIPETQHLKGQQHSSWKRHLIKREQQKRCYSLEIDYSKNSITYWFSSSYTMQFITASTDCSEKYNQNEEYA